MNPRTRKTINEICTDKKGKIHEGLLDWLIGKAYGNKLKNLLANDPGVQKANKEFDSSIENLKASIKRFKDSAPGIDVPTFIYEKLAELEKMQGK